MRSMLTACLITCAMSLAGIATVQAQYPTKPVRLIVPFPPGGGTDTLARILGPKLAEVLGQQVVIDNRPGAGANIGAEVAAKTPPDGYTLLMGNVAHAINVSLYSKLNYDLVKDFSAVSLLASTPNIVVVHPSVPVKSVKELIALAKARPGQLDVASSGAGSSAHLAGELFNSMAGTKMNHVPYKGGGPAVVALVGGRGVGRICHHPFGHPARQDRQAARARRHERAALALDAGPADRQRGRAERLRGGNVVRDAGSRRARPRT